MNIILVRKITSNDGIFHWDFQKWLVLWDYYEEIEFIWNRTIEYVQQVWVQWKFEFVQNINHKNYTIRWYVTDSKKVDINTVFLS